MVDGVHRRRFLGASLVAAGAVVAGCARPVTGRTVLAPTDEQLDADGLEHHLRFDVDGERLAVLTLDQTTRPASPTDPFRVRLHVAHRSDEREHDRPTTIRRFRFDLRAPPSSVRPPAEIYLETPGGPSWLTTGFHRTADSWTRIASDDAASVGAGTLTLSTLVRPVGVPADEVGVRAEVRLSSAGAFGRDYVLETRTTFAPVSRDDGTAPRTASPGRGDR